jgi:hypothetical protein
VNLFRRLIHEEDGQGLIFGAVTLFVLVFCIAMVHNVGQVAGERTRVQSAADAAAYAGALIEADVVSSVAWMNEGMAYVYYHMMRYAVDNIAYSTLAEFKKHPKAPAPPGPQISDDHLGEVGVEGKAAAAHQRAKDWIDRGEQWLKRISNVEESMAMACFSLMRQEIFRVARECGAEYTTVWPDLIFWPHPDSSLTIDIEKLSNGWRLTADNGYWFEVTKIGDERWRIQCSNGTEVIIGKIGDDPAQYEIQVNDGTYLKATEIPGVGWLVTGWSQGESIRYEPAPSYGDGAYKISSGGSSAIVRRGPGGTMQEYTGGGWKDMVEQDSVTVDGTKIPINQSGAIHAGGADIYLPNRVDIGQTRVDLLPDRVLLTARIGCASLRIESDDEVVVNWLSNLHHDDGKWRTWIHPGVRYGSGGKWRHRMTELNPTTWRYEYQENGSHFVRETPHRFGITHALYDNDPQCRDYTNPDYGELPTWTEWFNPETGRAVSESRTDAAYYQTRTCWNPDHNQATKVPDRPGHYYADTDGDGNVEEVPCPICCQANFPNNSPECHDWDGDGINEVRFHQVDSWVMPGGNEHDNPNYAWQRVDFSQFRLPLVLGEAFFQFQVNVGCWKERKEDDRIMLFYEDPPWGYFSVSSARIGFLDINLAGSGDGVYKYRFRFGDKDSPDLDARQEWLESYANLYEPHWTARLTSTNEAIYDEDLDVEPTAETAVNWIYKGMAYYANWRDRWNGVPNKSINAKLRRLYKPRPVSGFFDPVRLAGTRESPYRGRHFDLSDIDLEKAIKH